MRMFVRRSPLRVIAVPRLHQQVLLFRAHTDAVISRRARRAVRAIPQAVLVAQLFLYLRVDLADAVLSRNLKHARAGLTRDSLQHLLAIRLRDRKTRISSAPAHAAPASTPAAAVGLLIGEQNRVYQRVGTLRCLDRPFQRNPTGVVDAVGQDDQRLTPLLLLHQLVRCKKHRVVQRSPAGAVPPTPLSSLRYTQILQSRTQFLPRRRQILE